MAEAKDRLLPLQRHEEVDLPKPVYGCSDQTCAEAVSYPPEMLRWWKGYRKEEYYLAPGWYCESCIDELQYQVKAETDPVQLLGPTLKEEIERRRGAPPHEHWRCPLTKMAGKTTCCECGEVYVKGE